MVVWPPDVVVVMVWVPVPVSAVLPFAEPIADTVPFPDTAYKLPSFAWVPFIYSPLAAELLVTACVEPRPFTV